jgi:hypothetical protein
MTENLEFDQKPLDMIAVNNGPSMNPTASTFVATKGNEF